MKCHQILTGAANRGDRTFGVGAVEGVPFTAYSAGCNVVILSSSFDRVQIIPGASTDNVQGCHSTIRKNAEVINPIQSSGLVRLFTFFLTLTVDILTLLPT